MTIRDNIAADVYEKLIDYAMKHSDAVMTVWFEHDPSKPIETVADLRRYAFEVLPDFEETPEITKRWEDIEEENRYDKACVEAEREPFIKKMAPYRIKIRYNDGPDGSAEWPSTHMVMCGSKLNLAVYGMCEELRPLLLAPDSYLSWRYPHFPEDLSFFQDNRCWLYASSHEEYIKIFPRSKEEYDTLLSLGVEIEGAYEPIDVNDLFYEEYETI